MIDEEKIQNLVNDPSLSIPEIKEELSKLDAEYEDIIEFITVFIGDKRFEPVTAKHRGMTKRKYQY